ncbi:hypothetical protein ACFL59_02120 [Planctomycetota bacterium]
MGHHKRHGHGHGHGHGQGHGHSQGHGQGCGGDRCGCGDTCGCDGRSRGGCCCCGCRCGCGGREKGACGCGGGGGGPCGCGGRRRHGHHGAPGLCGHGSHPPVPRYFVSKEEKVEHLLQYKEHLEKELRGLEEEIERVRGK